MENFDPCMDPECILLCDTLNTLPGIETFSSCCGHSREPYRIFMKVSDLHGLRILGRCTSRNYSSGKWRVVIDNSDGWCPGEENPVYIYLESTHPLTPDEMALETAALEENLRYWSERIP